MMRQSMIRLAALSGVLVLMAGCAPLFHPSAPPTYYALNVPALQDLPCPRKEASLCVWPFAASQPYDRTEMVIASNAYQMLFSSQHRWIAAPGEMLAEQIATALSAGGPFQTVVMPGNPAAPPSWNLSGHIHRFALSRNSDKVNAELDVRVVLWEEGTHREVRFQKTYGMKEEVQGTVRPELFAEAMSRAVGRLVERLARDLCAAVTGPRPDSPPRP
jgi:ABC-type uncharacterized transport system auxiliary subunit